MPVAEKKVQKKTKKGAEKAPPAPPPANITVRDCMVWPEPPMPKAPGKGAKKGARAESKPLVYRSTLVRREKTAEQLDDEEGLSKTNAPPPPRPPRRDDGTVIEALRGWPGSREEAEVNARSFEVTDHAPDAKLPGPKAGKNSKKKAKKGASKEEAENVYIGDLIHQRYLNEHLDKRRKEMERDQRNMEESAFAARAGRRAALERSNIKANRTSQLRSIALAEKVKPSPLDLWKMPKFTRGAQPHLSTMGGGRGGRAGAAGRSDRYETSDGFVDGEGCDGGGKDGGCYCDYHKANYVDESEDEIQYGDGHCCDGPMANN